MSTGDLKTVRDSLADTLDELVRTKADLARTKDERDQLEADRDRYAADFARAKTDHIRHLVALLAWANERWSAEIDHRPRSNIYRKTLEGTWGQIKRKLADAIADTTRGIQR